MNKLLLAFFFTFLTDCFWPKNTYKSVSLISLWEPTIFISVIPSNKWSTWVIANPHRTELPELTEKNAYLSNEGIIWLFLRNFPAKSDSTIQNIEEHDSEINKCEYNSYLSFYSDVKLLIFPLLVEPVLIRC